MTLTGLLLLGTESALRRWIPTHEVAFQVLDGTDVKLNEFFRGPLLRVFERLEELFAARNEEHEIQVGLFRVRVPTVDAGAFREAVVNALTHRDYSRMGSVHIQWANDELVISNPGGFVEPTLHPGLLDMLRACADLGLVTSLVTNGSRLHSDACRRLFPWLRWLVLSCDSHVRATNVQIGRAPKKGLDVVGQAARVEEVAARVHEWNELRAPADHVRLKINIVVTSLNVHEDPSEWLTRMKPERVKLLQCCIIPGENDDAAHLKCDAGAFHQYAARLMGLPGIKVVAETSDDLLDSYAMVDPLGRFRQARAGGYVESDPIHEVGVERAWEQTGGCNLERFRSRGGEYDDGRPCRGVERSADALTAG